MCSVEEPAEGELMKRRTAYTVGFVSGVVVGSRMGRAPYEWVVRALGIPRRLARWLRHDPPARRVATVTEEAPPLELALDHDRVAARAVGRPPEEADSDNPQAQSAVILLESERRIAGRADV
jgi:hypothetical protein